MDMKLLAIGYSISAALLLFAAWISFQPRKIEGKWRLVSLVHDAQVGRIGAWFDPETGKPFIAEMVGNELDLLLKDQTIVRVPPAGAGELAEAIYEDFFNQRGVLIVPPGCALIRRDGNIYLANKRRHGGRVLL